MRFYIVILCISLLYSAACFGQQPSSNSNSDKVYTIVDKMPVYEGGMRKFYEYLRENIQYPSYARNHNIQGRVYIEFIIDEKGMVNDTTVKVAKGVHESLDNEALRLIKNSGKWVPGYESDVDKNVKVRMVIPITFRLGR